MKKYLSRLLAFTGLTLVFTNVAMAQPFGEKVNCRTVTGELKIYGGYAKCSVYDNGTVWIEQYVSPSTSSRANISEWINGKYYSCWANVPYLRTDTTTTEVCDYKPLPGLRYSNTVVLDPYGGPERWRIKNAFVTANSRDYDGNVVSQEIWVDGVKFSGTTVNLWQIGGWNQARYWVRVVATDNDGYVAERLVEVLISYELIE